MTLQNFLPLTSDQIMLPQASETDPTESWPLFTTPVYLFSIYHHCLSTMSLKISIEGVEWQLPFILPSSSIFAGENASGSDKDSVPSSSLFSFIIISFVSSSLLNNLVFDCRYHMLVIQDCITSYTKNSKRGYMNAHHFFRNFMSRGKIPFLWWGV